MSCPKFGFMEMILITYPEPLEGEQEFITELFERGLQNLHLRKYDATEQELLDFLKRIPPEYHQRIVLHHHHYLVRSFKLKGVHFNSYTQEIPSFPKGDLIFSRAVHDPEALEEVEESVDRVILSPIFPALSKEGDHPTTPPEKVEQWVRGKQYPFELYALGGILPERVSEAARSGFDGIAVLGGIWERFRTDGQDKALQTFEVYQKELEQWNASA